MQFFHHSEYPEADKKAWEMFIKTVYCNYDWKEWRLMFSTVFALYYRQCWGVKNKKHFIDQNK